MHIFVFYQGKRGLDSIVPTYKGEFILSATFIIPLRWCIIDMIYAYYKECMKCIQEVHRTRCMMHS